MPAPAQPHHLHLTLDNGLRVSLRHSPHLKRCAGALRVAAGSHDAPPAWPGLAHFLEHLLFLGTVRFPTGEGLMAYVQRHGGQVNASTRERTTDFFFEVPVLAFDAALERLGDMLANPRLDIGDQLREREVLHAEFIAWSRDAAAQQQRALLEGVAANHPLRAFHAGNRYSLPVQRPAFQQALRDFYEGFYQTGQMSLSLTGPQSLADLQALAQRFSAGLKSGPLRSQQPAPALASGNPYAYPHVAQQHLHQLIICTAPRESLDFLCTWINASAPGGLFAQLRSRQLITGLNAAPLYQFDGQALLDIDFTLSASGAAQTPLIEELLQDWLVFFAHSDWSGLREEYRLLVARKRQAAGALAWVRQDSEDLAPELAEHDVVALKQLLDSLALQAARHPWQLPPKNPFLSPATKAERPGLIRGQTSAHRGLRTFAQDRSRGRRELAALRFTQPAPDDSTEGVLYLQWRLDSPPANVFPHLQSNLQTLCDDARQAGVELSFEAVGRDWRLKISGLHEPMPAVLEQLGRALTQADQFTGQATGSDTETALIPIRQLLKDLPACCAGLNPWATEPSASLAGLQGMWSTAGWQGLGVGLPEACQIALKNAASRLPGRPVNLDNKPVSIRGQRLWHRMPSGSSEAALLVFCPTPTQSLADEATWHWLAHLGQAPFYQRLRVELQLGYAVFSGVRQINGQTGLLFGVQSPSVGLQALFDYIQAFVEQLPGLIDASDDLALSQLAQTLASQFEPEALSTAQAGERLWQAQQAGHPSDYLEQLHGLIKSRTRADLLNAAHQLNRAEGGWRCLANGPSPGAPWHSVG